MTGYVVYVDQVLTGNLLMNYLILWLTGRLGRVRFKPLRLLVVAGLGSIYSLALFWPAGARLLGLPAKIAVSLLMVAAAFFPLPPRRLAACLGIFYLASFSLGGLVLGLILFLHPEHTFGGEINNFMSVVDRNFWPGLVLATAAWLCTGLAVRRWRRNESREVFHVPLVIELADRRVKVDALVDTGNRLTDPLSGDPVVVVEYEMIKDILPQPIRKVWEGGGDNTAVLGELAQTGWGRRFRLIPFRSLGQNNGLLIGVRPDAVEVCRDGQVIRVQRVVVGICHHRLDDGRTYRALIPPDLLSAA